MLKVIGNTCILSMVETISKGQVVVEKTRLGVDILHQFPEVMFPGPVRGVLASDEVGGVLQKRRAAVRGRPGLERYKACTRIGKQGRCAPGEYGDSE